MIETERKLVIFLPDEDALKAERNYSESRITQIYISDPCLTHRVRKREYSDGRVEYTENTKKRISIMSVIENEREITEAEYESLALRIEEGSKPLSKLRRTFSYLGRTVEIDSYPEWKKSCILEVELESESEELRLPEYIKIIREVTGEKRYSNHSMTHSFPNELI